MDAFVARFLHVDMDAFYVEVERLSDPSLVGVPVVVAGMGDRGVVTSASYEARAYGVRSAMPTGEARRRCRHARFVSPNMDRYGETSNAVFEVLRSFTPYVEPLSIDEAFLDVAKLRLHFDGPLEVANEVRCAIRSEVRLPASVGIATVKFLAKMASKAAKPDGVLMVAAGEEEMFLAPLDVGDLWGVGRVTRATLGSLGIGTVADLAALDEQVLARHVGVATAAHLSALASGKDDRVVDTGRSSKGVSVEATFESDLFEPYEVGTALLDLCHRLSGRLRHAGLSGRTMTLKVRFGDFRTITRSATPSTPVADTSQLWKLASELLNRANIGGRGVRLLGVGLSGVDGNQPSQLTINDQDRTRVAEASARIRNRFGNDAVRPARLVEMPGERLNT